MVGPTMPRKVINLDCTPGEAARERNLLMCHFTSCCYRAAQLARHRLFLQEVAMNLFIHLRLPRHIVYSVVYMAYPHFADMAKAKKERGQGIVKTTVGGRHWQTWRVERSEIAPSE